MTQDKWQPKNKEAVEEDLDRLRQWLEKQPHLPHNLDKELLLSFVQSTTSLEIAKTKLDNFLSDRGRQSKYLGPEVRDASLPAFVEAAKALEMFCLPNLTPDGYIVLFAKTTPDFEECFDHLNTCIRFFMILELAMVRWPACAGLYCVGDLVSMSANAATKISPTLVANCTSTFLNAYPTELRAAFGFNSPSFVAFLYNTIVKPFLGELGNMVRLSDDDESFVKDHIPEEMLPSNYGGKEKPSSELHDYWMKQMLDKKEWFASTSQIFVNEAKRPGVVASSFGVEGTFRSLAID